MYVLLSLHHCTSKKKKPFFRRWEGLISFVIKFLQIIRSSNSEAILTKTEGHWKDRPVSNTRFEFLLTLVIFPQHDLQTLWTTCVKPQSKYQNIKEACYCCHFLSCYAMYDEYDIPQRTLEDIFSRRLVAIPWKWLN